MKGPSRKDDSVPPKNLRHDYSKETKMKSQFIKTLPITFDEAKASCKARKRKERQESISSLYQERKVIRSNSEERPQQRKYDNKNIRRVSSNEDFYKIDLIEPSLPKKNDNILMYDDCEHEKRRSNERFSKPLTFKGQKKKKPKTRCLPKQPKFKPEIPQPTTNKTEVEELKFLQLHQPDEKKIERSPSPIKITDYPPDLDLKTLHEQVDCSEPLLSVTSQEITENTETLPSLAVASNRLLSSPRNSIIATHRIYLDPDIPKNNLQLETKIQNPLELRLQKITKQINNFKKTIKKYEGEFETKNGYKLSHADKLNDKNIRKLYLELNKLRKEQKQLMDVCPNSSPPQDYQKTTKNLQETLQDIEKKLVQKREAANRNANLERMSNDELVDEKIAVQKALLYLESIHGRPDNKDDRNLVRPIYDRYRLLKRMVGRVSSTNPSDQLATIHEDETMNFIPTITQQQQNNNNNNNNNNNELDSEKSSILTNSTDSSDTDTSLNENLHSLTRFELLEQHRLVSEEKKELRRTIKLFEMEIQQKTGRMVQKDDKLPIEHVYTAYKKVKAKLKLLDALVQKPL